MPNRAIGSSYNYTLNRKVEGQKVDLTGYTLQVKVKGPDGLDTAIDRAVTQLSQDNLDFIVNITPSETQQLGVGVHKVCNKIENASLGYANEVSFSLTIEHSCF